MKESFETNLAAAQKTEAEQAKAFSEMSAAKSEEVSAGKDQKDAKTQELAAAEETKVNSKADLEATSAQLEADTKFLADVKTQCATMDQEYEERVKSRQMEMAAVSKALEFLTSDEAHALVTRTFNPSFLQLGATRRLVSKKRAEVARVLSAAARRWRDPRLSLLATRERTGTRQDFSELKKSIQTMVDGLIKEKEDDVKHRDFCIEQLNTNERETSVATQDKADLDAKVADLAAKLDGLNKEIEALKAKLDGLNKEIEEAGEDREKANKDFQVTIQDQRATQKLVATALGILKGFYEKAALVQERYYEGS